MSVGGTKAKSVGGTKAKGKVMLMSVGGTPWIPGPFPYIRSSDYKGKECTWTSI